MHKISILLQFLTSLICLNLGLKTSSVHSTTNVCPSFKLFKESSSACYLFYFDDLKQNTRITASGQRNLASQLVQKKFAYNCRLFILWFSHPCWCSKSVTWQRTFLPYSCSPWRPINTLGCLVFLSSPWIT